MLGRRERGRAEKTHKTADRHPIWMRLAAASALHAEHVEEWVLGRVVGLQVRDAVDGAAQRNVSHASVDAIIRR